MDGQNLKDTASDVRFLGDYFQLWIKSTFWCVNDGGRAMCVDWIKVQWMDKYGRQCEENVTLE